MSYRVKEGLMGQGWTESEAEELVEEMREQVGDGFDPIELLHDFGLEPDYVEDLL